MTALQVIKDGITWSLSGTLPAILLIFLVAISFPIINHYILYRSSTTSKIPKFFLLGPSNAGKTSLSTLVRPMPFSKQRPIY